MALSIEVESRDDYVEIFLSGDLDVITEGEFRNKSDEIIKTKKCDIIYNLKKLEYLDSMGLGAFISVLKKTRENNISMKLINMKSQIYKLFKITNLNNIFEIEQSKE